MIKKATDSFIESTLVWFALFAAFLASTVSAHADNLVVNGDFSSDISGWTAINKNNPPFIGTASNYFKCYNVADNPAGFIDAYSSTKGALEQSITLPAGKSYTLSFREWGQFDPSTVNVIVYDGNNVATTLATYVAEVLVSGVTYPGPVFQCTGAVPVTKSFDISSFAGQTIKLHFDASATGNNGTFAAFDDVTISSSGGGSPTPTPTPTPDPSAKRKSAIQLFCNRSGDLSSAVCNASVADASVNPTKLPPSGTVEFTAVGGSLPLGNTCALQTSQYTPGISSCTAQYTPPASFPIGVPFPIDALYTGDSIFQQSATSHKLFTASCVGTPTKPCPSSVGATFADYPAIIKNALDLIAECGGSTAKSATTIVARKQTKPKDSCSVSAEFAVNLSQFLVGLDVQEFRAFSRSVKSSDASQNIYLKTVKLAQFKSDAEIQALLKDAGTLEKYLLSEGKIIPKKASTALAATKLDPKKLNFSAGSIDVSLTAGSQKHAKLKLAGLGKLVVAIAKRAHITTAPFTLSVTTQRNKGKKKTVKAKINVILR